MNTEQVYSTVKSEIGDYLTEIQQAVMLYEVEKFREKLGFNLRNDVQDWINAVCKAHDFQPEALVVKSRKAVLLRPRQIIMWGLAKRVVPNSLTKIAIGRMFNRDHATVNHAEKKVEQWLDVDAELRECVMQLVNEFGWRCEYDTSERKFSMYRKFQPAGAAA